MRPGDEAYYTTTFPLSSPAPFGAQHFSLIAISTHTLTVGRIEKALLVRMTLTIKLQTDNEKERERHKNGSRDDAATATAVGQHTLTLTLTLTTALSSVY